MAERVLLIGATGQLGRLCLETFKKESYEVLGTGLSRMGDPSLIRLDMSVPEEAAKIVTSLRPDICLIAGAMTDVEGCESGVERAYQVNAESPAEIARAARLVKNERGDSCRVVYLSTEYVFDGENGPYDESAVPNPLNVYGKSKLEGERRVLEESDQNLVVRTTVVYSFQPDGNNFMMQLLRRLSSGEEMRVVEDQISSPTYAPDLAAALEKLIAKKTPGVVNVCGPDILGRYDFAIRAARILGLDKKLIKRVLTAEINQKARRPLNAGLLNGKLKNITGDLMRAVAAGVKDFEEVRRLWALDRTQKSRV